MLIVLFRQVTTPSNCLTVNPFSKNHNICSFHSRSWQSVATLSPQLLSVRLSVTSRRNSATLPWTSNRKCRQLLPPPPWRRATNFPMVRSSPSETRDSGAQRPSSSHPSWVWNLLVSTKLLTTLSWSVMSTSGKTFTPTLCCLEVPLCSLVSIFAWYWKYICLILKNMGYIRQIIKIYRCHC